MDDMMNTQSEREEMGGGMGDPMPPNGAQNPNSSESAERAAQAFLSATSHNETANDGMREEASPSSAPPIAAGATPSVAPHHEAPVEVNTPAMSPASTPKKEDTKPTPSTNTKTPETHSGRKENPKDAPREKSGGGLIAAVVVVLLFAGGMFIWKNNARKSTQNGKVKTEALAPLLDFSKATSTKSEIKATGNGNDTIAQNKTVGSETPSKTTPEEATANFGQYPDPFLATIGVRLAELKTQLEILQKSYATEQTIAQQTHSALENLKGELITLQGTPQGTDIESGQNNIATFQDELSKLQMAGEFVSLHNARALTLVSDMREQLAELAPLISAYRNGQR